VRSARRSMMTGNKYGAHRTWSKLCQRWFASKAEAVRGEELALLEKAREIRNLQYQLTLPLSKNPKVTITLDFVYELRVLEGGCEVGWLKVYEDVKGVLTRDFRTKMAWLKEKYGIDVELRR